MLALTGLLSPVQADHGRPPNIVLFLADDLGYGEIGSYGQTKIQTPYLDAMAEDGMLFTQVYAGANQCMPSRASLVTGLHAGHAGIRANRTESGRVPHLEATDITVADVLGGAGYATAVIGKWHVGDTGTPGAPSRQGFAYSFVFPDHDARDQYPEFFLRNGEKHYFDANRNDRRGEYAGDIVTEDAVSFIQAHKDERFFLYLPYLIPHVQHLVPESSLREYRGKFPETPYVSTSDKYVSQAEPNATIAGMITRLDGYVARILQVLRESGIDDETIVVFTSDNGPAQGAGRDPSFFAATGQLRGIKGDLYEGGIRVPMLVRWPQHVARGQRSDAVWAFWDLLPTFAELAGADLPANFDGVSIVPTLLGRQQDLSERYLYWEDHGRYWFGHPYFVQAARWGKWKAWRLGTAGDLALYDLSVDIGETRDVASHHPDVTKKMAQFFQEAHLPSPDWPAHRGPPAWARRINAACNQCLPQRVLTWFE